MTGAALRLRSGTAAEPRLVSGAELPLRDRRQHGSAVERVRGGAEDIGGGGGVDYGLDI